jgi:hypothetical protein
VPLAEIVLACLVIGITTSRSAWRRSMLPRRRSRLATEASSTCLNCAFCSGRDPLGGSVSARRPRTGKPRGLARTDYFPRLISDRRLIHLDTSIATTSAPSVLVWCATLFCTLSLYRAKDTGVGGETGLSCWRAASRGALHDPKPALRGGSKAARNAVPNPARVGHRTDERI